MVFSLLFFYVAFIRIILIQMYLYNSHFVIPFVYINKINPKENSNFLKFKKIKFCHYYNTYDD